MCKYKEAEFQYLLWYSKLCDIYIISAKVLTTEFTEDTNYTYLTLTHLLIAIWTRDKKPSKKQSDCGRN